MRINTLEVGSCFTADGFPINVRMNVHRGSGDLHRHKFYEFVYVESGFSLHCYNGHSSVLTAGDFFGMRPGDVHGYTEAHSARIHNILFLDEAVNPFADELRGLPGLAPILGGECAEAPWARVHLTPPQHNDMLERLHTLEQECEERPTGWRTTVTARLADLLVLYSRCYESRYASDGTAMPYLGYIRRALEYVDNRVGESFTVADVAAECGITPDYLSRQFKSVLGMTPIEYIRDFRLAHAMSLLKNDLKMPVSDIASDSGFNSVSHFTREFRARVGQTPTAYRGS